MPSTANTNALRVHGISARDILNNHNPTQRAQWEAFPGTKGLILPFDPGYTPAGAAARIPLLQRAIRSILHLTQDPRIGSPAHDNATFAHNAPPHFYLLAGISVAQLNTLVAAQVWSTEIISFMVFPFSPPPSRYVGSFAGLILPPSPENVNIVETMFRNRINGNEEIRTHISNYHDNIPNYASPQHALNTLTSHLSMTAWNTPKGAIWNLYIDSPTRIPGAFDQWKALFARLQVISLFEGSASHTSVPRCTRCFSHDHTSPNCPFPLLPGWLGPPPLPSLQPSTPTRGRGGPRGRGTRGRGYNRGF